MLFIPPTLEKELKKQKRVFSVVIRPPKSNDSSNLLIRRYFGVEVASYVPTKKLLSSLITIGNAISSEELSL